MNIGTMREKSLHAALKEYYCADPVYHEVPIAGGIADLCTDGIPTEIQTGNLGAVKKKLDRYQSNRISPVRVVVPLICRKWICRTDPETGECTRRLSPRHGKPWDILYELSHMVQYLCDPLLLLTLIEVDIDEYRIGDGTRADRVLLSCGKEISLNRTEDFAVMLPPSLPNPFTCSDFARITRVRSRRASAGLYVLRSVGVIAGEKQGRQIFYHSLLPPDPSAVP